MIEISRIDDKGASTTLVAGELTIYNAAAFKDSMKPHLEGDAPLALDLSGVTEMDTSGMQVLILLKRECGIRGKGFRITETSRVVNGAMDLLNLNGFLKG